MCIDWSSADTNTTLLSTPGWPDIPQDVIKKTLKQAFNQSITLIKTESWDNNGTYFII